MNLNILSTEHAICLKIFCIIKTSKVQNQKSSNSEIAVDFEYLKYSSIVFVLIFCFEFSIFLHGKNNFLNIACNIACQIACDIPAT